MSEFEPVTISNRPEVRQKALELSVSSYQHLHLLGGASSRFWYNRPSTTEVLERADAFTRYLALGEIKADSDDEQSAS